MRVLFAGGFSFFRKLLCRAIESDAEEGRIRCPVGVRMMMILLWNVY